MTKLIRAASYAGLVFSALAATASMLQAAEPQRSVREGQGVVTALGTHASAVTYWVNGTDGWHVVTTVDTNVDDVDGKGHAIVRFASLLQPGQSQMISLPVAVGERQPVLRIRRLPDGIEVEQNPALSD